MSKKASPFHGAPCPYCGDTMSAYGNPNAGNYSTLDHVVPQSRGGKKTIRVCRACNNDKGPLSLAEWRLVLMWRKRRVVVFHYERWFLHHLWVLILLEGSKFLVFC